jgi:hypothetical protein
MIFIDFIISPLRYADPVGRLGYPSETIPTKQNPILQLGMGSKFISTHISPNWVKGYLSERTLLFEKSIKLGEKINKNESGGTSKPLGW